MNYNSNKKEDLSGRSRIAINTLTSWGAYLVFVIFGFIMPRIINDTLGQVQLGIWDFCWSLVNYLRMCNMGFASSTNRYVAKYRAEFDFNNLRSIISTAICIQIFFAVLIIALSILIAMLLPAFFGEKLGENTVETQYVFAFLGCSLAIQMGFDTSRGILTGYHRWDLHNGITAGMYLVSSIMMIVSLLVYEAGLFGMSLAYMCVTLLTEILRMVVAKRISPEYKLSKERVSLPHAKTMLFFGSKTILSVLPPIVVLQTTSLFIAGALGPAALAMFSRPLALVRIVETLIRKFSYVLTPTVGSLRVIEDRAIIREFLISSTRYGVAFTLPMLLPLVVYGDVILEIWMGSDYANLTVMSILAIGYFFLISQYPVLQILVGLNKHGRISLLNFGVTLSVFFLGIAYISMTEWSLVSAALVVAGSLTVGNGFLIPLYACKELSINLTDYIVGVFRLPVVLCLPLLLIFLGARLMFSNELLYGLLVSTFIGSIITLWLYWCYLAPDDFKRKVTAKLFL